jgi:nitroimidazol reductase NimA-like FMN-containing flavoprotein (pyridoxamine 5'-phosphate oxidase superfamily)
MTDPGLPEDITLLLRDHDFGVLATTGDTCPHASLISISFAADYSYLVFPTLRLTRKYTNLLGNKRVSVLLDNRSRCKKPDDCYALTLSGPAERLDAAERPQIADHYLAVHPHMREFLLLPDTAFIKVTIEKVQFVEGVQKIREFIIRSESR